MRTILDTRPIPRIVPDGVFDAFGWCASRALEWRRPDGASLGGRVTSDNPPRMVFVMKREVAFLPRELASLHVPGPGLEGAWALAPYGIDDATDALYAHDAPPEELLWLATDSLAGLFWGLHDWAHFHNHGPFTERAWTELQCDAAALAWLWGNRDALSLAPALWDAARRDVLGIAAARFQDEGVAWDEAALDGARIQGLLG